MPGTSGVSFGGTSGISGGIWTNSPNYLLYSTGSGYGATLAQSSDFLYQGTHILAGNDKALFVSGSVLPAVDNGTGVIGTATNTWSNGQFTNLTVDSTLNVRAAIDLADSDILRMGSSDDWKLWYNGSTNYGQVELETTSTGFIVTDNGTTRVTFYRAAGTNIYATGETRTNSLRIDTVAGPPPTQPPGGPFGLDAVYVNTGNPNFGLGEPDYWIDINLGGVNLAVPGYEY